MRNNSNDWVLITGCAGFIGSNLTSHLLSNGYRVIGIDDLSQGVPEHVPLTSDFIVADLCKFDAVDEVLNAIGGRSVQAVFHFAAKNCISDCEIDRADTHERNIGSVLGALEISGALRVKHFFHAETSAFYEGVSVLPTPESCVSPISAYSQSKFASALVAKRYCRRNEIKYSGLRYFNVYGPNQDVRRSVAPVIGAFLTAAKDGSDPIIYGSGDKRRDFIHVEDVNRFHQSLLEEVIDPGIYNVGSGNSVSIKEVYELCREVTGRLRAVQYRPDLPGEAQENRADPARACAAGFKPQIDLRQGIELQWLSMN